jgi:hypothetical protein
LRTVSLDCAAATTVSEDKGLDKIDFRSEFVLERALLDFLICYGTFSDLGALTEDNETTLFATEAA